MKNKNLVLLKTYYYRALNQVGENVGNQINFVTNPLTSSTCIIRKMTDKNYNPINNSFIDITTIKIPNDNPISYINDKYNNETLMIKTKCGFVSANTFYVDFGETSTTTVPLVDYPVTATSGNLKDAVLVRIEYDNAGTNFSNGVKFARRVSIYGYK